MTVKRSDLVEFLGALGTYFGGWRIIRTLGKGLYDMDTPQGFAAETSSTACILVSSLYPSG